MHNLAMSNEKKTPRKSFDKETLRKEYANLYPNYERLAVNLKQALEIFLKEAGIDYVGVFYRTKEFDSFCDKVENKCYDEPFEQTEDICGLRIVCFYDSDLERIAKIIKREFDVIEWIDKTAQLQPDQFGYRTEQGILRVKKGWLKAPNYRGLGGLKAEVQVRTTLMHAWAEIEHKLQYKKKGYVPDEFRRKFSILSAQLEDIDDRFEALRKEREEYRDAMTEEAKASGRFDVNQPMNIDSLQAFMDFYFPDRKKSSIEATIRALDEFMKYKIGIKELVEGYDKVKDILLTAESEELRNQKFDRWGQIGIVRMILELTNDYYWQYRKSSVHGDAPGGTRQIVEKWRNKLAERKE